MTANVRATGLGFQDASMFNSPTPVQGSVNVSASSPYGNQSTMGSLNFPGGSSNYLMYPQSSPFNWNWTSVDSTYEVWVNPQSLPPSPWSLFGVGNPALQGVNTSWTFNLLSNGAPSLVYSYVNVGYTYVTSNTSITANAWSHLAFSYKLNTNSLSLYVNGNLTATNTPSNAGAFSYQQAFAVGGGYLYPLVQSGTVLLNGAGPIGMTDFRATKGQALYTGAFAPPTAPLTASSNTQLLLRAGQGTHGTLALGQLHCGSNTIIDVSQNNSVGSYGGGVSASDLSPYASSASGSLLLNGNTASIVYAANATPTLNYNIWASDFSLETFVYPTTFTNNVWNIVSKGLVSNASVEWQMNCNSNGRPYFYWYNVTSGTGFSTLQANTAMTTNTWNHVATSYSASANVLSIQLNGNVVGQTSNAAGQFTGVGDLVVGSSSWFNGNVVPTNNPQNYITDLRLQRGATAYSGQSYSVPTQMLPATANTQLLLRSQRAFLLTNNQGGGGTTLTMASKVVIQKQVPWSSFTAYGSGVSSYSNAQYCVDELGYLRMRGQISTTSTTNSQVLLTLPSGAVPKYAVNLPVFVIAGGTYGMAELLINTSGGVIINTMNGSYGPSLANPTYISLDNMCIPLNS